MTTMNEKQHIFAQNLARLIQHVDVLGLTCSVGEVFRTPEQAAIYAKEGKGIIDSQHCKKLAVDLQLFSNGIFLQDKKDYKPLGDYWMTLDIMNVWGGTFPRGDCVHFEMRG